eukprot:765074-Rhodomonas_salina.1
MDTCRCNPRCGHERVTTNLTVPQEMWGAKRRVEGAVSVRYSRKLKQDCNVGQNPGAWPASPPHQPPRVSQREKVPAYFMSGTALINSFQEHAA